MVPNANLTEQKHIPLTFDSIKYGSRETPWDMRILLWKGGASARREKVNGLIESNQLGKPCTERIPLVEAIHLELNGRAISGRSRHALQSTIQSIRIFFAWADENNAELTIETIEHAFLDWTDYLITRSRIKREISEHSAYAIASATSSLIDSILERPTSLIRHTRLTRPRKAIRALGILPDKQNLSSTFEFGRAIQDICDALTIETVMHGDLPITIPLREGGEIIYRGYAKKAPQKPQAANRNVTRTVKSRHGIINIRIEAELFMFIAQTGMNLTQAHRLKIRNFRYASHLDGYQVHEVKARRGGAVLFEIFREFKPHFERYLAWRRSIFQDSELLFPFYTPFQTTKDPRLQLWRIQGICSNHSIPYISPQKIRNTRINWLLRQSGDPSLTAEMAQHSKQTLLEVYERPSLHRALIEVTRFWSRNDPTINQQSVGPGACDGIPIQSPDKPKEAPTPDCIRPSGCLWCEHHRDVDSQDHIWSLASFGHLKRLELLKCRNVSLENAPAQLALKRINDKLSWFYSSNQQRRAWVEEANALVDEGDHHPMWKSMIKQIENP